MDPKRYREQPGRDGKSVKGREKSRPAQTAYRQNPDFLRGLRWGNICFQLFLFTFTFSEGLTGLRSVLDSMCRYPIPYTSLYPHHTLSAMTRVMEYSRLTSYCGGVVVPLK